MTTMIGHYREFLEPHPIAWKYPCMKDDFSEVPIPEKEKIIDFILNAGFLDVGTTATAKDVFTGRIRAFETTVDPMASIPGVPLWRITSTGTISCCPMNSWRTFWINTSE